MSFQSAKLEANTQAVYTGGYSLNVMTRSGAHITKKKGETFTSLEVAAFHKDTFDEMVRAGSVTLSDKPKQTAQKNEGDK